MEPRFIISTRYDKDEMVRFNRAVLYNVWRFKRTIILSNVALLVMIVTSVIAGNYLFAISLAVALAAFNWYFFIGVDMRAARSYEHNKLIKDQVFDLSFYDDHYEGASELGTSSIPYSKLNQIIETPTNFYIMHEPTVGTIIKKADSPDGFIDFIHEIKEKYIV